MFLSPQFHCEYPGCQHYKVDFDNATWRQRVFPRTDIFAGIYLKFLRSNNCMKNQKPPKETYCLMNIPDIVGLVVAEGCDELFLHSQDEKGVCSWGEDSRPGTNWTFLCPPGPGDHFRFGTS